MTDLAENPSSVPSTLTTTFNSCSRGFNAFFWPNRAPALWYTRTHTQRMRNVKLVKYLKNTMLKMSKFNGSCLGTK